MANQVRSERAKSEGEVVSPPTQGKNPQTDSKVQDTFKRNAPKENHSRRLGSSINKQGSMSDPDVSSIFQTSSNKPELRSGNEWDENDNSVTKTSRSHTIYAIPSRQTILPPLDIPPLPKKGHIHPLSPYVHRQFCSKVKEISQLYVSLFGNFQYFENEGFKHSETDLLKLKN